MPILLLATLLIVFYFPVIFRLGYFWTDFLIQNFPTRFYAFTRIHNFQLPFWDPYTLSGHPVLADLQHGIFFPLNWLLIPFINANNIDLSYYFMELEVLLSVFLTSIFMYFLLRHFNLSKYSSILGAIIYTFSSFFTLHLAHVNIIDSAMWLPLIFLFFDKGIRKNSIRYILLSSLFMGLSLLGSHPQIVTYIALLILGYIFYFAYQHKDEIGDIIRHLLKFGLMCFGAILISMVQSLPFLYYFMNTNRSGQSLAEKLSYSLNPAYFVITSIFPHILGGFKAPFSLGVEFPFVWGTPDANYWEWTGYISIVGIIFLILCYFINKENNYFKFFRIVALTSLLLSFGKYIFPVKFIYYLPVINLFRGINRFLLIFIFGSAILVSYLFEDIYVKNDKKIIEKIKQILNSKYKYYIFAFPLVISFFISLSITFFKASSFFDMIYRNNVLKGHFVADYLIVFLLDLTVFSLIFFNIKRLINMNKKYLIIGIVFTDLFLAGFFFNPMNLKPSQFFKTNELVDFLKQDKEVYRVSGVDNRVRIINQNSPLIYNIYSIDGFQGLSFNYYNDFTDAKFGGYDYSPIKIQDDLNFNRLSLLNVKYLVFNTEKTSASLELVKKIDEGSVYSYNFYLGDTLIKQTSPIFIYKNLKYLPHVFVSKSIELADEKKALELIDKKDYDPYKVIYIEKNSNNKQQDVLLNDNNSYIQEKGYIQNVALLLYKPEEVILKTNSNFNGFLFLSDTYYPDWRATIDGFDTQIFKANVTFRAIYLPQGEHLVKFSYPMPLAFKIGGLISIFSLIILLFLVIILK